MNYPRNPGLLKFIQFFLTEKTRSNDNFYLRCNSAQLMQELITVFLGQIKIHDYQINLLGPLSEYIEGLVAPGSS